jgi:hypothetical protein
MEVFDFAIGWPVKEENDLFLNSLAAECQARNMRILCIHDKNLASIIKKIKKRELKINFYLDMASEIYDKENPFTRFVYLLKDVGTKIIDDPDYVKSTADKSITHFNLLNAKISVPYTVVIRNWEPKLKLAEEDKQKLGFPFIIKPALGYGQKGVKIIYSHRPLKDIAEARLFDPGDNFLIQELIKPNTINNRPAWFRCYHLFGEIIPCWWNPETHEYWHVTLKEISNYGLLPIIRITAEIANIVRVDWFSCEIALSKKDNKFYAIDYMNDQCAIYPKSQHKDGVPDDLIQLIAERVVEKAWRYNRGELPLAYRAVWFPKIMTSDINT